jgi:diguanylate cyclase (GGDEF)-like protein/PAS domain S-box-containing protein
MIYKDIPLKLCRKMMAVAAGSGEDFIRTLDEIFSNDLDMDFLVIGRLDNDGGHIRSTSLFIDHQHCENLTYSVEGTPCERMIKVGKPSVVPSSLKKHFPSHGVFYQDAECYFGMPLFSSTGQLEGLMAVLGRRKAKNPEVIQAVLKFFAARVAVEMDRRTLKEKLLAQRRRSQAILDAVPFPIFFKNEKGVYTGCNTDFERFIGLDRNKIIGQTVYGVSPEEFAAVYHEADQALFRQGGSQSYETAVRYADGSNREVLFQKAVFKNPDGVTGGIVGTMIDITARKEAEKVARYLSHFDPLTNLPNQVLFTDRINMKIAASHRVNKSFALFCLDLDHFKKINNAFGHLRGDQILQMFAKRLTAFLHENDTISRMGGDSFNLLIPDIDQESTAAQLAKRLLEVVSRPFTVDEQEVVINASLGISIYPHDGADAHTLLKNADTALQQAKEKGRNTLQFFASEMNTRAEERMLTEGQLRKALAKNEFVLHYQPQVDAATLKVIGIEALVRWQHPTRGLLFPANFISLAEETGLIIPLGEWVLRTACIQGRKWQDEGAPPWRIGVNLSPRQFQQPELYDSIRHILSETGFKPKHLSLEITESVIMKDVDHAIQTLARLKKIGVHISVDDFGTGYSSLSYLKHLPIDMLKIDRSFVMEIPASPDDMAIVTAVISMAHNLNIKVLAEGVQSDDQKTFLQASRCDELQGYFFSHPLDAEALQQMNEGAGCGEAAPIEITQCAFAR